MWRSKKIKAELDYIQALKDELPDECKNSFNHAILWRHSQAEAYRKWFYFLKWAQAVLGVAIMIMTAFSETDMRLFIAIAAGISTLFSFGLTLHKFYDSWKRYRSSVENIKSLTRRFIFNIEPFGCRVEHRNKQYIIELDKIINHETGGWLDMRKTDNDEPKA